MRLMRAQKVYTISTYFPRSNVFENRCVYIYITTGKVGLIRPLISIEDVTNLRGTGIKFDQRFNLQYLQYSSVLVDATVYKGDGLRSDIFLIYKPKVPVDKLSTKP